MSINFDDIFETATKTVEVKKHKKGTIISRNGSKIYSSSNKYSTDIIPQGIFITKTHTEKILADDDIPSSIKQKILYDLDALDENGCLYIDLKDLLDLEETFFKINFG